MDKKQVRSTKKQIQTTKKVVIQNASATDYVKYFAGVVFVVAMFLNLEFVFTGIHHYLLDRHSFRQTQTALTTYYIWKDGFKLAYETPILGAPWSIPFEFPLYQWIVAELKHLTGGNMDYIGRLVCLAFFYLSLVYAFLLTNKYIKNASYSLLALAFVLLMPTYIFWSRTFMIESTALFFSLMWLYHTSQYMDNKKWRDLAIGTISGVLAGLVKVTTFLPIFIAVFLLAVIRYYRENKLKFDLKRLLPYFIIGGTLFLIPVLFIKAWTDFSDAQKKFNDYAYSLVSITALKDWNFGTVAQKTSWETYQHIALQSQISNTLFYLSVGTLAIWSFIAKFKYYKQALFCLGLYILAPLIFTNLYYIHDYYTYANSIFLCGFIGFSVLSLLENQQNLFKIIGVVYAIIILFFFVGRYEEGYLNYYKAQQAHPDYAVQIGNIVKQNTRPDDVIIVYGNNWGSEYAYYSERKAIALSNNIFNSVNDSAFVNLMKVHKNYNIGALVLVSDKKEFNKEFANELVNYTQFKPILQQEPFWIFVKDEMKK